MARECKFLELDYAQYWEYEQELNKWINQGYEVKHIISLDSLESQTESESYMRDYYYRYRMEGRGFLFYLEREVVKKAEPANKPTPKYEEIVEDSYQLPF